VPGEKGFFKLILFLVKRQAKQKAAKMPLLAYPT